jgi:hypothetical protein
MNEVDQTKKGEGTMYTISEVVDLGNARELILGDFKVTNVEDDSQPNTFEPGEYFDE